MANATYVWAINSVGRVLPSHGRSHRFESCIAYQTKAHKLCAFLYKINVLAHTMSNDENHNFIGGNMELSHKKILQNILYYSLVAIIIALSIIYMIALSPNDVMMYAKVIYWIWIDVLVLALVFDIICTIMGRGKFISGMIFFVLSVLCIAMGIIVYFNLGVGGVLVEGNIHLFNRLVVFSGVIDVLALFAYTTGEFIITTRD